MVEPIAKILGYRDINEGAPSPSVINEIIDMKGPSLMNHE